MDADDRVNHLIKHQISDWLYYHITKQVEDEIWQQIVDQAWSPPVAEVWYKIRDQLESNHEHG
jgi:hypothetical protein